MSPDSESQTDKDIELSVPRLEPDYSIAPYATGPGIVPPTIPANQAPFIREEPEPVLGPEHGPFVPREDKRSRTSEPSDYVDVPPVVAPADRWGIPVTERLPGHVGHSAQHQFAPAIRSSLAGLGVGLLIGLATAATMALWRDSAALALIVAGFLVGGVVSRVWGTSGFAQGMLAATSTAVTALATVVTAKVIALILSHGQSLSGAYETVLGDPRQFFSQLVTNDSGVLWIAAVAMLVAYVQGARPRAPR